MNIFGIHERALYLRSRRSDVLASNIFNAATPHFKARDINVESVLQPDGASLPLATTRSSHMPGAEADDAAALYRQPLKQSLDGNTVDTAYEQVQFAENAVQYRATLSFINSRITTVRRALRGE